jgi:hypothetical protein
MLLAIIKCTGGTSGIKWEDVATALGGEKTDNAIRQEYQKMKAAAEKGGAGGADEAGDEDGGAVKPPAAATKKKKAPAKKRKIEDAEVEDEEDGTE